ncbi:hypothetical protein NPIL_266401 [Nephila pilipes]|uniref:Uncharacterized protein n=1 Tax=Nephila pilipes TaxID=299642 RepID=A0A8X6TP77_NEPPI|nr:hypothetical protein NPIL_266401 [Nephila pilipes]
MFALARVGFGANPTSKKQDQEDKIYDSSTSASLTQFSTLIRPIQSVFPLENGNDWKSLQFQRVLQTESAKSPNADSSEVNQTLMTRYGSAIRKPTKLNLLIISDIFE